MLRMIENMKLYFDIKIIILYDVITLLIAGIAACLVSRIAGRLLIGAVQIIKAYVNMLSTFETLPGSGAFRGSEHFSV